MKFGTLNSRTLDGSGFEYFIIAGKEGPQNSGCRQKSAAISIAMSLPSMPVTAQVSNILLGSFFLRYHWCGWPEFFGVPNCTICLLAYIVFESA